MVSASFKKIDCSAIVIFLFLAIFALGQLLRIPIVFSGLRTNMLPIDVLAAFGALIYFFKHPKKFKRIDKAPSIIFAAVFSLAFSVSIISLPGLILGSFYFLRVIIYLLFFLFLYDYVLRNLYLTKVLPSILVFIGLMIALLGLVQYFVFPDLRGIVALGWDNHLYRLVGTFIDPGFTGLLMAFGLLVALSQYQEKGKTRTLVAGFIMMIATLLTYSRASYLAALAGLFVFALFVNKDMKKIVILAFLLFVILIPFLPRPDSVGVKLERTQTVIHRVNNYEETFIIWKNYPLFGTGFNTICAVREEILTSENYGEHSCSGLDSSLLLILATTGVIGIIAFFYDAGRVVRFSIIRRRGLFVATMAALFAHSFFVNSLFYSWVMGWLAIVAAYSFANVRRKSTESTLQ